MQAPDSPDVTGTKRGFAENYATGSARPDEMIFPGGTLKPHWQNFVGMIDELDADELIVMRSFVGTQGFECIRRNNFRHVRGVQVGLDALSFLRNSGEI